MLGIQLLSDLADRVRCTRRSPPAIQHTISFFPVTLFRMATGHRFRFTSPLRALGCHNYLVLARVLFLPRCHSFPVSKGNKISDSARQKFLCMQGKVKGFLSGGPCDGHRTGSSEVRQKAVVFPCVFLVDKFCSLHFRIRSICI